jgi:hypothetical protein
MTSAYRSITWSRPPRTRTSRDAFSINVRVRQFPVEQIDECRIISQGRTSGQYKKCYDSQGDR